MEAIAMAASFIEIEQAKSRCIFLRDQTLHSLPPSKISPSSKRTLNRLLSSELRFLSSLHSPPSHHRPNLTSLNLGYLAAILSTIHHPSVHHVSRLCNPLPSPSPSPSPNLHVDIVCTFRHSPAWFFVSDRNPNYIFWSSSRTKNLSFRIRKALSAAHSAGPLKPSLIVLVFSKGLADDVAHKLTAEFGAVEIDFEGIGGRVFEIKVGVDFGGNKVGVLKGLGIGDGEGLREVDGEFGSLVSSLRVDGDEKVEVVNFDTTALVALVSGISNGRKERLLMSSELEMWFRFKSKYKFVITEVMHELEHPILKELKEVIAGKKGIICESVCSEFKELVLMCGGRNEKLRADLLSKHLLVVPDNPSDRVLDLPTTRKIASKNKVAFGTGDYWRAPTLTANMGFVRAILQAGMSLFTVGHRPRALIGD